jgi:hypothetical protein
MEKASDYFLYISGVISENQYYENIENKKEFVKSVQDKYAPKISFDKERYTPIEGMEGPFVLKSGKVVYYDSKEGKYYDRDSDMYLSDEDYHAHNNPRI